MLSAALPPPCTTCSTLVMFHMAATQRFRMLVVPTRHRSINARMTLQPRPQQTVQERIDRWRFRP